MNSSSLAQFDLVVLGGGPAGASGAAAAGLLGKRVALVEKAALVGGAGINTGTIPSKTLRETALMLSGWRSRRLFGVDLSLRRDIIGDNVGFLKLLFHRDDLRLLGVHVMGEQATEVVHIGLIAMLMNATAELFNRACFNYPTLGDLYKHAAYDAILQQHK